MLFNVHITVIFSVWHEKSYKIKVKKVKNVNQIYVKSIDE